jgi:hypothetical protein
MTVSRWSRTTLVSTALAAGVLVGGVLLSACSSGSSSATTTTSRSAPTSTSTTITPPTSTSPSGPTTTAAAGPVRCATTALSGSVVGSSGAAGTIETTVGLKSTASTPCTLGGFPGMQLVSASGSPLPTMVVRTGNYSFTAMPATSVTVGPGQSVYFNIGYSDVPVGNETTCPTSASIQVTPPNALDHLVMTAALAPCGGGTLVVSPVFLATGANTQTTAPPSG